MTKFLKYPSIILLLMLSMCPALAQPSAGEQWVERAFTYADYYWNCRNPDYGDYPSDCAHFASQIANAGCAGMCEYNNTGVPDWNQGDCPLYMWLYHTWPEDCHSCPSYNHQVIANAYNNMLWFNDNLVDWPNGAMYVDDISEIPSWLGPGSFAFTLSISGQWHAVFIGQGQGQNASYWAHTTDRQGAPISWLFESSLDHINLYGSGESPATISPDYPARAETENKGDAK